MLKKLFSFLLPRTARFSSTSQRFVIKDNKLTITHNGVSQTFDLAAGINDAFAGQLAQMGLSPSDLQNLLHLSQQAPSHPNRLLTVNDVRRAQVFAGSPQQVADKLRTLAHVSPDEIKRLFESGKSTHSARLTITVNGQQHTYDTTAGINGELSQQLAQQMGISVSELETVLKMQGHTLQTEQTGALTAKCQPAASEPRSAENPQGKIG